MSRACARRDPECSVVLGEEAQCLEGKQRPKGSVCCHERVLGGAIYSVTEESTEVGSGTVDWRPIDGKALEKSPSRQL